MNFADYKIIPNYQTNKTDLFTADEEDIPAFEKILNVNRDGMGLMGRLYFWIKENDLKEEKFENTWLILQCS